MFYEGYTPHLGVVGVWLVCLVVIYVAAKST
jgi:hypothetical protein